MSLTREALLERIQQPKQTKVAVEGLGQVFIRPCPQLTADMRMISYLDDSGQPIRAEQAKAGIHAIIDQTVDAKGNPIFTDDDFDALAGGRSDVLQPLTDAISAVNNNGQKKAEG